MNNKRNSRHKSRGSILVITALAAIVWIFIAQSLFIVTTSGFGMLKSSRIALQAQQYAEISVDRLKNIAYENLDSDGAHSRQSISGIQESGWEDEVTIGSEQEINGSNDAKQRIATVNVYKSGDTLPRFTLEVPLSSQGRSTLPIGTILPYVGNLSNIPSGWHLCDGTDGTPNLTGRFLQGWGWDDFYTRSIGEYIAEGLPNITGSVGRHGTVTASGSFYIGKDRNVRENVGVGGGYSNNATLFDASLSNPIYGNSLTVQPRSYTVYFIIRVK